MIINTDKLTKKKLDNLHKKLDKAKKTRYIWNKRELKKHKERLEKRIQDSIQNYNWNPDAHE